MASQSLRAILERLTASVRNEGGLLSDAVLLERFVQARDAAAFETLFWRHAPMVLGTCRRLLPPDDVDDAFQATFLVLVRRASSVRRSEALGAWLHRVAVRVAHRARPARVLHPLPDDFDPPSHQGHEFDAEDVRPLLDRAIDELPEKYRRPVVLCDLEGRTHDEAARVVGCPKGTLSVRLMRAREMLRRRLTRQGVTLSMATLSALAATEVPASASSTLAACLGSCSGVVPQVPLSPRADALARGVIRTMLLTRVKILTAILVILGLVGGATVIGRPWLISSAAAQKDPPPVVGGDTAAKRTLHDVISRREGQLLAFGTELKPGEKPAPELLVTVKTGDKVRTFRRLREGDKVEAGQMLGLIDDAVARDDLAIAQAQVVKAEAEMVGAMKTRDEARERHATLEKLKERSAISAEEYRSGRLTVERYEAEVNARKADVEVSRLVVQKARTVAEQHEIRTRSAGVIVRIYKHAGEGVKTLEPVAQIKVQE